MVKKKQTRNAHGTGNIRKRPDGRWEARYTVTDPITGVQKRKSIYGKTQKDVAKKLTAITNEIFGGTFQEPSQLLLAQWSKIWLKDYVQISVKESTYQSYAGMLRNHIIPNLGQIKLSDLRPHHIQEFYNSLMDTISPKTIKNIHGILHKALSQACTLDYMNQNPADKVNLPKIPKTELRTLDSQDMARLLQAIEGNIYEGVFLIDLFTGMRQSEIIGLTWDCINFNEGSILIYRQYQFLKDGIGYKFTPLKNNTERLIFPPSLVMDKLKEVQTVQLQHQLRAGSSWQNNTNCVFTDELGDHLKHVTVRKHFKKIVSSINMGTVRFHDLRHGFATLSLRAGDDIKTVQENLGHHTAAYTLSTYAHATNESKKISANKIEQYFQDNF